VSSGARLWLAGGLAALAGRLAALAGGLAGARRRARCARIRLRLRLASGLAGARIRLGFASQAGSLALAGELNSLVLVSGGPDPDSTPHTVADPTHQRSACEPEASPPASREASPPASQRRARLRAGGEPACEPGGEPNASRRRARLRAGGEPACEPEASPLASRRRAPYLINVSRNRARLACRNRRSAFSLIWRTRSRVMPRSDPISSRVMGSWPSRPK